MGHKLKHAKDPMGRHARLYHSIIDSPAWLALGFSAQSLYVAMRRDLAAFNNGNISATVTTLRHRGFKSSSTLAKGLRELIAVGLIDKTRKGVSAPAGSRAACIGSPIRRSTPTPPLASVLARQRTSGSGGTR